MIPILYDRGERAFISNGICRLRDCISCIVTEERNGIYECDFEYPVNGANYELIQLGRIIGVTHDDTGDVQPFDIVSFDKPIDGIVTFHCVHISYRLRFQVVWASSITSLAAALQLFRNVSGTPFSYWTNKTNTGYLAAADGIPRSVREMLGGMEGSVLDAYGGEFEWDKWEVRLYAQRGENRDFAIRYGVNMLDFNDETDISETWAYCVPYWTDDISTVIGSRQYSGSPTITGHGECVPLDLSDKFEDKPTKAEVEAAARAYMAANTPYLPAQTINVSFVRLQDMDEYAEFQNLLRCGLCDTVKVIFPGYDTSGSFKIVKTVWNVLTSRYDEMELGKLSTTLAEALRISSGSDMGSDILDGDVTIGGDLTVGGTITAEGHSSYIGWRNAGNGTKSYTTAGSVAYTKLSGDITLTKGKWLVIANVAFPFNANGTRYAELWADGTVINGSRVTARAVGTTNSLTRLQSITTLNVTNDSSDVAIYGCMFTGTASQSYTINYYWQVIRIS